MNPAEIVQVIRDEVAGDWSRSNAHGVDLKTSLVPPTLVRFEDSFNPSDSIKLWVVLEEDPENKTGYMIVFDDIKQMFGLAVHGTDQDVFIGYYGSFLDTLEGM